MDGDVAFRGMPDWSAAVLRIPEVSLRGSGNESRADLKRAG